MAVATVATTTTKPDRYDDYLDVVRRAKAVVLRNGVRNVRTLAALVAGEATGSFAFTSEADDFAAASAVLDKTLAVAETVALMSTGPASPPPHSKCRCPGLAGSHSAPG
jgi:hypothetical protein